MAFREFDPNRWSDEDLRKLIELQEKYGSVTKIIRDVDKNIIDLSQTKNALEEEIKSSANIYIQIMRNDHIPTDSSNDLIRHTKNIIDVRKQKDKVDQKLVKLKGDLEKLRDERDRIISSIETLCEDVQTRRIPKKNIEYIVVKNNDDCVKFNYNEITEHTNKISEIEKFRIGSIQEKFLRNINGNVEIPYALMELVKDCKVIGPDGISEGTIASYKEVEERNNNDAAANDAYDLAKSTEAELDNNNESRNSNIEYVNNDIKEKNDDEKLVNAPEPQEILNDEQKNDDNILIDLPKDETQDEQLQPSPDKSDNVISLSNNEVDNKPEDVVVNQIDNSKNINENEISEENNINLNETISPINLEKEQEIQSISLESSTTPVSNDVQNINLAPNPNTADVSPINLESPINSVEPINLSGPVISENSVENISSSGETNKNSGGQDFPKVDKTKDTVANTTTEKIRSINEVCQNSNPQNPGVRNEGTYLVVTRALQSVGRFQKNLENSNANTNVEDIFAKKVA